QPACPGPDRPHRGGALARAEGRPPDRRVPRRDEGGVAPVSRWLTTPVPRGRIAWFRTIVYLYAVADLVFFSAWVDQHAALPGSFYRPLLVGRLLHLPTPT